MGRGSGSDRGRLATPPNSGTGARSSTKLAASFAIAAVSTSVIGIPLFALAMSTGCGASYQALYEGEVRFEHCYRLDEEPSIPVLQKRECWREWTQFYTYGQTRDRIEYALMRQRVLAGAQGSTREATPDDMVDAGLAPTATLAAPPPTNPFAPPPQVDSAPRPAATPPPQPASSAVPSPDDLIDMVADGNAPPGQTCLLRCVGTWKGCVGNCLNDNARCRAVCDAAFKACGRGCI